jgi:hypothetical protein
MCIFSVAVWWLVNLTVKQEALDIKPREAGEPTGTTGIPIVILRTRLCILLHRSV